MARIVLVGLLAGGRSGVPRYAAALTNALDRVAPDYPDLEIELLTTVRGAREVSASQIPVKLVGWPFQGSNDGFARVVAEQVEAAAARADLLHFFDLTGPALRPRRTFVTTVHDAAIKHGFERMKVAHKHLLQPWALRRCSRAVAVSNFARDEAVRCFDADPGRVEVIHSGPGLTPSSSRSGESTAERAARPFFLYVGNISAHKNVPFLVEAFGEAAPPGHRLVLVGGRGERIAEVEQAIACSDSASSIELRTNVADAELEDLYRSAVALTLPSLYEGFGFTALEGMSRGCPVMASDIPAIREIAADGAMLLPPGDLGAWSESIRSLASDPSVRADLRRRGEERVRAFSWVSTARNVCGLFRDVTS